MILSPAWKGRKYAVLGLARTGRATVEALLAAGAEVTAWDSNEDAREAFAGRVPVMVGDDTTDEDAFIAAAGLGGYAIKVGDGESAAAYRLADPQAVADWISKQGSQ